MSTGQPSLRGEVLRLELGFGTYELAPGECSELAGLLRGRSEQPDAGSALAAACRLESLLEEGGHGAPAIDEAELDAIADAAWGWLRQVGPDELPPRVLLLLDGLRARRAHD